MKKLILPCICLLLAACATAPKVVSDQPLIGYSQAALTVRGMSCPLCSNNINGRLKKVPGIEAVKINLETGLVTVTFGKDTAPTKSQIEAAVKDSGFTLGDMKLLP